jgi:hypothetical protein
MLHLDVAGFILGEVSGLDMPGQGSSEGLHTAAASGVKAEQHTAPHIHMPNATS